MLSDMGDRFAGNNPREAAEDWLSLGFSVSDAKEWCKIGCWDPSTADLFFLKGLTPDQVQDAAQWLYDVCDDPDETYANGDPIYAVCNNDLEAYVIIDLIKTYKNTFRPDQTRYYRT